MVGGGLAEVRRPGRSRRPGCGRAARNAPLSETEAHKTDALAELVCSNSFRSDDGETNAVGLLHEEMRRAGSLIMAAADANKLPAGGALAVDRDGFARAVTRRARTHPLIDIERDEIAGLPPREWDSVIIATGPLTSPALARAIQELTGEGNSPSSMPSRRSCIATASTWISWRQSRYDKAGPGGGGADYINCPTTRPSTRPSSRRSSPPRRPASRPSRGDALFRGLPAHRGDGRARVARRCALVR